MDPDDGAYDIYDEREGIDDYFGGKKGGTN